MKKVIFIIILLIGTVSASGNIPIIYLSQEGNYRGYCIDNKNCLYNATEIKEEKSIWTALITLITIIAFSLILLYLFITKITDLNGYKKLLNP